MILDAPALREKGFTVGLDFVRHDGRTIDLRTSSPRGWLRRYAPSAWGAGLSAGSLEAVTLNAFIRLIGAVTRLEGVTWLTGVDAMLQAEDRLYQLQTAREMGWAVPATVVASNLDEVSSRLGEDFVVKPLATGYYWNHATPHAVFTSHVRASDLQSVDFGAAPFVAQEVISAVRHLRVVTVRDTAWAAALPGPEYDVDWRRNDAAHYSWVAIEDEDVCKAAVALARRLNVGYSSQDWIWDGRRHVFLDLNPGGQWMFLPDGVADPVTRAIACYLAGGAT